MTRKLSFKILMLIVLCCSLAFISSDVEGSAMDCWGSYSQCINRCAVNGTGGTVSDACASGCLFDYAVCENANWTNPPVGGPPGGGPQNYNYCPQVYIDRQFCEDMYPDHQNVQYWECYGAIAHNAECPGYAPLEYP